MSACFTLPACWVLIELARLASLACQSAYPLLWHRPFKQQLCMSSILVLCEQHWCFCFLVLCEQQWCFCLQGNDASNDFFLALAKVNDRVVAGEYYRSVTLAHALRSVEESCLVLTCGQYSVSAPMQHKAYASL